MRSDWEVVIGLETHAQLNTVSKIFSGASTAFGAEPNVQACAVDIALPGVLPVLNKGAVERAIRFGLAIGATVAPRSVFARKNYFYPDLPKGYQISQFELPVVQGGEITIRVGEGEKAYEKIVHLTRAHLEEDAGKSLHEDFHGQSGIDLNRAGTPLLGNRHRAGHVLLRRSRGLCQGTAQPCAMDRHLRRQHAGRLLPLRCQRLVRRPGEPLGTRREIKNLNSFRFLQQAIDYEIQWQIETIEDGGKIQQATVLFDPDTGETRVMRTKEDAHDYRYFPDPDLLPLEITDDWKASVQASMPELPAPARGPFSRATTACRPMTPPRSRPAAIRRQYFVDAVAIAGAANAKLCATGSWASWLHAEPRGKKCRRQPCQRCAIGWHGGTHCG